MSTCSLGFFALLSFKVKVSTHQCLGRRNMVYRGKPSPSCERCRSRRLKVRTLALHRGTPILARRVGNNSRRPDIHSSLEQCNYQRPSCASCIRAGAVCTGYRDQSEFVFQDQSEEVVRNYQRPVKKKCYPARSATLTDATDAVPVLATSTSTASSSPRSLSPPVRDVARGYLFTNYMTGGPRTRYMAYLVPLISDVQNHALNAAVSAVALAALSNIHASPRTMVKAHVEYYTALCATNHALRDSEMCKRDDILAAVVMLGIFEVSSMLSPACGAASRPMTPN